MSICLSACFKGPIFGATFPFTQRWGDRRQCFSSSDLRGCEILSNIFWSLGVRYIVYSRPEKDLAYGEIRTTVWRQKYYEANSLPLSWPARQKKINFGFKLTDDTLPTCLFCGVMTFDTSSPFTENLGSSGQGSYLIFKLIPLLCIQKCTMKWVYLMHSMFWNWNYAFVHAMRVKIHNNNKNKTCLIAKYLIESCGIGETRSALSDTLQHIHNISKLPSCKLLF